jgi:hypothetical protein
MPGGKPASLDSRQALIRLNEAVEPRQNILRVHFNNRNNLGRFYADVAPSTSEVRVGSKVGSLIRISKSLRNSILFSSGYVDIDQAKSHPTLMCVLGGLLDIPTPGLEEYVRDPARVIALIGDFWSGDPTLPLSRDDVKNLINRTVYGGGLKGWLDDLRSGSSRSSADGIASFTTTPKVLKNDDGTSTPNVYASIRSECEQLMDVIYASNPTICTLVTQASDDLMAKKRRVISYFCQTIEHFVTYTALEYCVSKGYIPTQTDASLRFIWGFDGFSWVPPPGTNMDRVIAEINEHVHTVCGTAFDPVRFVLKPILITDCIPEVLDLEHPLWHSNDFRLFETPTEIIPRMSRMQEVSLSRTYEEWKTWFEQTHFKVEENGSYAKEIRNSRGLLLSVHWLSHRDLNISYHQYSYSGLKKGVMVLLPAIPAWMRDNTLRLYEYARIVPPPLICPSCTFNLWNESPYHDCPRRLGELDDPVWLHTFLELIRVVCGGTNGPSTEYLTWFIADMIQRPGVKPGVVPVLTGSEGTGKTLLTTFICRLVGEKRFIDTKIENIVGDFNSLLENRILVVINELPRNMSTRETAAFKSLVTDKELSINTKQIAQHETRSYHRFIATTNDTNIINSDRRPFYVRSSLELKGDWAKLTYIWDMMDNIPALVSIYRHFQTMDIRARFGEKMVPPNTALNRDFRAARNPMLEFGRHLVHGIFGGSVHNIIRLTGTQLHTFFEEWARALKFGPEMIAKNIPTVTNDFVLGMSWPDNCISESFVDLAAVGEERNKTYREYNLSNIKLALEIL